MEKRFQTVESIIRSWILEEEKKIRDSYQVNTGRHCEPQGGEAMTRDGLRSRNGKSGNGRV